MRSYGSEAGAIHRDFTKGWRINVRGPVAITGFALFPLWVAAQEGRIPEAGFLVGVAVAVVGLFVYYRSVHYQVVFRVSSDGVTDVRRDETIPWSRIKVIRIRSEKIYFESDQLGQFFVYSLAEIAQPPSEIIEAISPYARVDVDTASGALQGAGVESDARADSSGRAFPTTASLQTVPDLGVESIGQRLWRMFDAFARHCPSWLDPNTFRGRFWIGFVLWNVLAVQADWRIPLIFRQPHCIVGALVFAGVVGAILRRRRGEREGQDRQRL